MKDPLRYKTSFTLENHTLWKPPSTDTITSHPKKVKDEKLQRKTCRSHGNLGLEVVKDVLDQCFNFVIFLFRDEVNLAQGKLCNNLVLWWQMVGGCHFELPKFNWDVEKESKKSVAWAIPRPRASSKAHMIGKHSTMLFIPYGIKKPMLEMK